MTDFNFPDEFDARYTDASEGVWFNAKDRAGNHLGKFLCALIHDESPKVQTYRARQTRARKDDSELTEEEQIDISRRMFIECSLLDWELKNAKGDPIPFDKKSAHEYFQTKDSKGNARGARVMIDLFNRALNVLNYQPDPELPEGN
jgi:hypothetical protein